VKTISGVPHSVRDAGTVVFIESVQGHYPQKVGHSNGQTILYRGPLSMADVIASGVVGRETFVPIVLTSTGTGAGVATLSLQVSEETVITLDGAGRFYSDAGGTLNESTTWTISTTGSLQTMYIKVTSGTSNLTIDKPLAVTKLGQTSTSGWVASTNAPSMEATNWYQCTNLVNLSAFSCNLTGSVSEWSALTSLTYLSCSSTSVSGDVSGWSALTSLTILYCYSTSVSGDVSGWSALTSLTILRCNSTSISGDVSGWSALTSLTTLRCNSTSVGWSGTSAWSIDADIQFQDCNWTATEVNNCLASLAGGPVTGSQINIAGNNAARTSASDADVAIITDPGNSNTLTVNE